mgnify:FL=1
MANNFLKLSFLLGALVVALGAFGAHALKEMVDEKAIHTYQTGVLYHFFHVFALAIAGLLARQNTVNWFTRAGYLFIAGIILFSGSLYTMTFFKAAAIENMNWIGAITPLGGVSFIAGWFCLFLGVNKLPRS